jgi:Tfp pilus assembly protein PilF
LPDSSELTSSRISRWLAPLSIVAAGAIAYGDSLRDAFVYDDRLSLVDNPAIRHLGSIGQVLSPAHEAATLQGRPFLSLTFAINYALGGLDPLGYHLVNLAIHVLAGVCLYSLGRRFTGMGAAWAVALLWTVHPLQTESVTYIVQRAESLMGLCYLATILCYCRFAETGRRRWAAGAVACCLAGVGTKEVMVSAPVMLWLFDRAFLAGSFRAAWKARKGLLIALAATWLPLIALVAATGGNRSGAVGFGLNIRPIDYWLTQGEAVLHYLRLAVWPSPLVLDYGRFVYANPATGIVRVAAVAGLIAATIWAWRKNAKVGFLGWFFFAILAPTSLLPGTTQMMAEHRMYLALAPVLVLLVVGAAFCLARWSAWSPRACGVENRIAGVSAPGYRWIDPRLQPGAVLCVAGVFMWLTWRRNVDYRSDTAIWADTAAKRPGSAIAHYNFGYALGPSSKAEEELRTSIRLNPRYIQAYDVLGYDLSLEPSARAEAIAVYRQALAIDPNDLSAENNLGQLYLKLPANFDVGVELLTRAAEQTHDPQNHFALGVILSRHPGHERAALGQFEEAVRLDPRNARAHSNLAASLAAVGAPDSAVVAELREAVRLDPKFVEARFNLAVMLARDPARNAEAIAEATAVLAIKPDFEPARELLSQLGR